MRKPFAWILCAQCVAGCATGEDTDPLPITSSPEAGADASLDSTSDTGDAPSDTSSNDTAPAEAGGDSADAADAVSPEAGPDVPADNAISDVKQEESSLEAAADSPEAGLDAPDAFEASQEASFDAPKEADTGSGCAIPTEACSAGGGTGGQCDSAVIVPRQSSAIVINGEMQASDGDDNTPSCALSEADRYYRIFLKDGESVDVTLTHLLNGFDGIISIRESSPGCSGTTCEGEVICQNAYHESGMHEHIAYTATHDGWYTIIADARLNPLWSYRFFTLQITLSCTGSCGC